MQETKTPVHVFRDLLTALLRDAKLNHTVFVERAFTPAEARAHDWAPWYAEYVVGRLNELGIEVNWGDASFPSSLSDDNAVTLELTGPMGRAEVDAAKARSYDFGPDPNHVSNRRHPHGFSPDHRPIYRSESGERYYLGPVMTEDEWRNAFGVTAQRED